MIKAETSCVSSDDIIIAVVGVTGAGKSTFISHYTDEEVEIGTTLESWTVTDRSPSILGTQVVKSFKCSIPGVPRFYLVDSPGFDDSTRSDADVLRDLSTYLAASYTKGIQLSGIIYLHRIMDVRFGGAAGRNLRVFKRLCGDDNLGSVVLATTFWRNVSAETGAEREQQLQGDKKFWKDMIEKDSKVFRQDRGKASGEEIIRYLVGRRKRVTLQIQHELVKQKKTFAQTGAGVEVLGEIQRLTEYYEKQMRNKVLELEEARKERDEQWEAEIADFKRDYEAKIDKNVKAAGRLRTTWDHLWVEIEDQFERHCVLM
ncbi:MAG: hypothetical protein Q9164_003025 [Protoblastenia rupestris]